MSAYAVVAMAALLDDPIPLANMREGMRRRWDSSTGLSVAAEQVDERSVSKTTYNSSRQCDLGRFQPTVRYGADRSHDRDVIRFPHIPHCADF